MIRNSSVINRKVVRWKDFRLMNLLKFIEWTKDKSILIWLWYVDVTRSSIWIITSPYIISDSITPQCMCINTLDYACTNTLKFHQWVYLFDKEFTIWNIGKLHINDGVSDKDFPFINDLFGCDISINQDFDSIINLYNQCVELLSKEKSPSKTTSTTPIREGQMESGYTSVTYYIDDMPTPSQTSNSNRLEAQMREDYLRFLRERLVQQNGTTPETSVGETSTNPF